MVTKYLIIKYNITNDIFSEIINKNCTTKIKISQENVYHNYNLDNDIINYKNKLYDWWNNYIYDTYPQLIEKNNYSKKELKYIIDLKINPKNIDIIYITKEFSWK